MTTLIDTNVLVDIAVRDPAWSDWSRRWLARVAAAGGMVVNPIVYSEFSFRYETIDDVDRLLPEDTFRREDIPWHAAFLAARAFRIYRSGGGQRTRVLPDFLIGAHAAIMGYRLLTRDPSGYRRYFPTVDLITPETHP
ncbi:type II toxin-antitoxin system VapC family toxin [Rhizobium sp. SG2393]|uniref:type II toxin-antitoxin system VapC family toxin n=1 Tax=Rhizobium sp. SG2393 TaxID=3276279 RepID=UPI00367149D8